jgi:hypothetical protein
MLRRGSQWHMTRTPLSRVLPSRLSYIFTYIVALHLRIFPHDGQSAVRHALTTDPGSYPGVHDSDTRCSPGVMGRSSMDLLMPLMAPALAAIGIVAIAARLIADARPARSTRS